MVGGRSRGNGRGMRFYCPMNGGLLLRIQAGRRRRRTASASTAGACAKGAFGSTGQRCTATSRAIVMEDVADAFVAKVLEHAQAVRAGHPLDEATTMGPSVSDKQLAQVMDALARERAQACIDWLVENGVPRSSLKASWEGLGNASAVTFIPRHTFTASSTDGPHSVYKPQPLPRRETRDQPAGNEEDDRDVGMYADEMQRRKLKTKAINGAKS